MTAPSIVCARGRPNPGSSGRAGVRRQRGTSIIEALIASLLLSVMFLGLAHVLSRGVVSQRFMNTQNLALLQIRDNLQQTDQGIVPLCDGEAAGQINVLSAVTVNSDCTDSTIDVNLTGLQRTVPTRNITVSTQSTTASQGLFGGDGVISLAD